jgi:hypothetical protein
MRSWADGDDTAIAAALEHLCDMATLPLDARSARSPRAPGRDLTNVRKAVAPQPRKDAGIIDQTQRWVQIYRSTPAWRPPIPGEPAENEEVRGQRLRVAVATNSSNLIDALTYLYDNLCRAC